MDVIDATSNDATGPQAFPVSLTWEGHDFVAAARNDSTWSQVMKRVKSVGAL